MLIRLNSKFFIEDIDGSLLACLKLEKHNVLNKSFGSLVSKDVPELAMVEFYQSSNRGWKHSSILKLSGSNSDYWFGYKSSVYFEENAISSVVLRFYEVGEEVQHITKKVFKELRLI